MRTARTPVVHARPLLLRRRDSAALLSVSETVVIAWERAGWLPVIKLPGLRATRHAFSDVKALADRIRRGELA